MSIPDLAQFNPDGMDPIDLDRAIQALQDLLGYTMTKRVAMKSRAGGNITEALKLEAACEKIYAALPENWRW